MKKSEVIKGLQEGSIQVYCTPDKTSLLREILEKAFPLDRVQASGNNCYYALSNNGRWKSNNISYNCLTIVKLSEVTEDEVFEKGEMVEVRDSDCGEWLEKEFIIEYKGKIICMNNVGLVSPWKQIRKINPLQKELDALQEKAKEKGITVNVEIKY